MTEDTVPNVLAGADAYITPHARDARGFALYMAQATGKDRLEFNQLAFLLTIAEAGDEGISVGDVAARLGRHDTFGTRNTKVFDARSMGDKPMIEQRIDQKNPRYRLLSLTDYGKALLGTGLAIFAGEAKYDPSKRKVTRLRLAH